MAWRGPVVGTPGKSRQWAAVQGALCGGAAFQMADLKYWQRQEGSDGPCKRSPGITK